MSRVSLLFRNLLEKADGRARSTPDDGRRLSGARWQSFFASQKLRAFLPSSSRQRQSFLQISHKREAGRAFLQNLSQKLCHLVQWQSHRYGSAISQEKQKKERPSLSNGSASSSIFAKSLTKALPSCERFCKKALPAFLQNLSQVSFRVFLNSKNLHVVVHCIQQ